jgi:hypothetical protein
MKILLRLVRMRLSLLLAKNNKQDKHKRAMDDDESIPIDYE